MDKNFILGSVAHVSVQGQGHNYHTIKYKTLCSVRFVSPTLMERFSFILAEMFTLTMCRTHVIHFLSEGQGYT